MNPTLLLIDADVLLYKSLHHCEKELDWGNDLWTLHIDINEALTYVHTLISNIYDNTSTKHSLILCFSDKDNFRKSLYPEYKATRKSKRKPLAYSKLKELMKHHYTSVQIKTLEADDILGMYASMLYKTTGEYAVIASIDKDLKTIPCLYYDITSQETIVIDANTASYNQKFQTLVGDSTDNFKGCPKVGGVTAHKILAKDASWEAVIKAYDKAGVAMDKCLIQARLAHILDINDYDFNNNTIKEWTFNNDT